MINRVSGKRVATMVNNMHFDGVISQVSLNEVAEIVRAAQELDFVALWTSETQHGPFLPCALIAVHSSELQFCTAIALSFARSPTTLTYAWENGHGVNVCANPGLRINSEPTT